jgi:hypothetical protein
MELFIIIQVENEDVHDVRMDKGRVTTTYGNTLFLRLFDVQFLNRTHTAFKTEKNT